MTFFDGILMCSNIALYIITITLVIIQSLAHINFTFYEGTKVFVIFLEELFYENTSKFIKEMDEYFITEENKERERESLGSQQSFRFKRN